MHRRGVGYRRPDARVIDGERTIGVAIVECQQGLVPREMPIQDAAAVVFRHPITEKGIGGVEIALLEQRMRKRMGAMGVLPAHSESPFGQRPAALDVAGFGVRPAQICQEPPILAVMRGMTLADRHARRIMIGAPREGVEPVSAEKGGEHQSIAGEFLEVLFGTGKCRCRPPFERGSQHLDMLTLAPGRARHKFPGA